MWKLIIIVFCLCCFEAKSQSDDNGIYLTHTDFKNTVITNIFPNQPTSKKLNPDVWIETTLDSIKQKNKTIWGVRMNRTDWRLFKGEFYRIDYSEKIIIYTLPGFVPYDSPIVYDSRYFSLDESSPLIELTKRNLKKLYKNNPEFVKKLNALDKSISVSQRSKKCNCFIVTQLF